MSKENQHIMYSLTMDSTYHDDIEEIEYELGGNCLEIGDTVAIFRHIMKPVKLSDYRHCNLLIEEIEDDFLDEDWFDISLVERALQKTIANRPKSSSEIKGLVIAVDDELKIKWEEVMK